LNALRDGKDAEAVKAAVQALKARVSVDAGGPAEASSHPMWADAVRLFSRNKDKDEFNKRRLGELSKTTAVFTIQAKNSLLFDKNKKKGMVVSDPEQLQAALKLLPEHADDCGGLEASIKLAVGAKVMLRRNIHTEDGLVNGAIGTVTGFQWGVTEGEMPVAVMVKFEDPRVGRMASRNMGLDPGPADNLQVVTLHASTAKFNGKQGTQWERKQFPLSLCWATTIHKVQGLSMDKAVLDLGDSIWAPGQAYVALSRLRTLEGVLITKFNPDSVTSKFSSDVEQEYRRLRGDDLAEPPSPNTQHSTTPSPPLDTSDCSPQAYQDIATYEKLPPHFPLLLELGGYDVTQALDALGIRDITSKTWLVSSAQKPKLIMEMFKNKLLSLEDVKSFGKEPIQEDRLSQEDSKKLHPRRLDNVDSEHYHLFIDLLNSDYNWLQALTGMGYYDAEDLTLTCVVIARAFTQLWVAEYKLVERMEEDRIQTLAQYMPDIALHEIKGLYCTHNRDVITQVMRKLFETSIPTDRIFKG
jgi:hypothetical protein